MFRGCRLRRSFKSGRWRVTSCFVDRTMYISHITRNDATVAVRVGGPGDRDRGKPGTGSSWDTFSLLLSTPHTLSSQPLSSLRALVRVAAGLPGGFSRARIGPFGLRGDARGRCRSRRERIAKPATPRPVLRPLGIAQGQRCRTRRHLPGLPRTEHPPQPAGGPRRRMLGAVAQRVGDQLVAEPDVWLQHRPQRTRRRTAVAPARRGMRRMGGSRHAGVAS